MTIHLTVLKIISRCYADGYESIFMNFHKGEAQGFIQGSLSFTLFNIVK